MKKNERYLEKLKDCAICPFPHNVFFDADIQDLGATSIRFILDRYFLAWDNFVKGKHSSLVFSAFSDVTTYRVYHTEKFKAEILRKGIKLGLLKTIQKMNEGEWMLEFDLKRIFEKKVKKIRI